MPDVTKKCLLIDVDSTIPNLALMHISTWKKREGYEVGFNVQEPDEVYASIVFDKNRHKADGLRYFYPDAVIDIGGGGYDLNKRLPEWVDLLPPDYSLYPECDYSLGFTSRGCNRSYPFCVVPRKEGRFRRHQHPSEFYNPRFKKMVLMDNNILFDKAWFFEVTDWILEKDLRVDFNQGLDVRLIDKDVAERIAELRTFRPLRFAFDSVDYEDKVANGIQLMNEAGIKVRNRAEWYVYLDSDEEFDSALYRCKRLKELMRYRSLW